jgi:DNA polymerase III alpha subunit (gram-positive type)
MKKVLYVCDTETTGLDYLENDIIELSLIRLNNGEQETWKIRPTDFSTIQVKALEVNNTNINDLKNPEIYMEVDKVLPLIENWIVDDGCSLYDRVLVGHNIQFDFNFMLSMWEKANTAETFPFSRFGNLIDTKGLVLLYDYLSEKDESKYNLAACVKRFGLQKRAFHGAAEDTAATKDLFEYLCKQLRSI